MENFVIFQTSFFIFDGNESYEKIQNFSLICLKLCLLSQQKTQGHGL